MWLARRTSCTGSPGLKTPVKISRKGIPHGGDEFTGMYIYRVLQNPLYLGLTKHYDKTYPGEHEAIIDKKTWDKAQELLAFNLTHSGKKDIRFSPLRGLIRCGCCGGVIMETFTQKKDKRYRYFACEKDMKRINSICPLKRVPAAELENLLLREIGSMLAKPEVIAGVMHQAAELDEHGKHLKLPTVQQAFDDLTNVWDVMFPVERYKFINEVVEKITVHIDDNVRKIAHILKNRA